MHVPTITTGSERKEYILADRPARFNIIDNTKARGVRSPIAMDWYGRSVVVEHHELIEREAARQGVDPDLVRAIVYVENSHGYYDAFPALVGAQPSTIRPVNINPEVWGPLGIDEESAKDPEVNIRAGVTLIKRLRDRIEDPTPRKVAALYNLLRAEHTDNSEIREYVARVGNVYKEKPWLRN